MYSHPTLKQVIDAHRGANDDAAQSTAADRRSDGVSTSAPESASGSLFSAVTEVLRGRGAAGTAEQREAVADLRVGFRT